jgi:hypothetical protein
MRPCPVCESPVSGWTCEVCGKELDTPPASAALGAALQALEGLELTELPGLPARGERVESAPDLEPTLRAAVPEVRGDPLLGLEPTESSGPDIAAGGLPDVDLGRETAVQAPTVVPAAATCRYCRNVQTSGLFCDRCGMRLPRPVPASEPEAAAPVERVACPRCFERTPADRPRCGACGALLQTE